MNVMFWMYLALAPAAFAQQTAQEAIQAQTGCFEVTFQYEEVEAHQEGYTLAPPKRSQVFEWVTPAFESDDRIVLQHILVTPPMIKHWRQIWEYEGTSFHVYDGVDQWRRETLTEEQAAGAWVQVVDGVADNPRYGCSAPWQLGESASWTCETWAPKPRRDKDRDDYTVLNRTNTHRILDNGWVHEQRNTKLMVTGDMQTPIVTEKGYNTYIRVDDSECAKAVAWWPRRSSAWMHIQDAWTDVTGQYERFSVDPKRGVFPLWIRLFWLARKNEPPASLGQGITRHSKIYLRAVKILERHVAEAPAPTTAD